MAAAEARATWQRVANRCYVQEDAKRAPKLACHASSSTKPQYDENASDANKAIDPPALNFMSLNRNLLDSSVSSTETKWWLQYQPNIVYQNDCMYGKLTALAEEKTGGTKVDKISPNSKVSYDSLTAPEVHDKPSLDKSNNWDLDLPQVIPVNRRNGNSVAKVEELKAVNSYVQAPLEQKMDCSKGDGLFDWENIDHFTSKNPEDDYFIVDPQSIGKKKSEPWWIADKGDLAMFVAQRSMEQIDNCDLPRPHKVLTTLGSFDNLESSNDARPISTSKQSSLVYNARQSSYFDSIYGQKAPTDTSANSSVESEKVFSGGGTYRGPAGDIPTKKQTQVLEADVVDPGKTQLMEALCHSQTRARKAEMAAQKAYDEKEHVVTLLFRQASHLFAYRQWLRLLQLESLCLQLKIREHSISSLLPEHLLWTPSVPNNKPQDGVSRRRRKRKQSCGLCRNLFAFVIGFSLASAGLLLGWTAGCLLTLM